MRHQRLPQPPGQHAEPGALVRPPRTLTRRRRRPEPKEQPDWKPERFAGFWAFYPRGESKQAAIRAWDALKPDDALIDTMAQALVAAKATEAWQAGIGIPYASTWINQRRWEDEHREPETQPSGWAEDPEVYT